MKVWFDDYELGETIRSPYLRIHGDDVRAYARYTHDLRCFLMSTPDDATPDRFVPPLFTLALGMCLLQQAPAVSFFPERLVAFLQFDYVEFPNNVYIGDVIHSVATVEELRPRGARGEIVFAHSTYNQRNEVIVSTRYGMLAESKEL